MWGIIMRRFAAVSCAVALSLFLVGSIGQAGAQTDRESVATIDHFVPHISTVPAIAGHAVQLYVRERAGALDDASLPGHGRVVLFVHGATYPSAHGFDLPLDDYSWMAFLAGAGFDVFGMDMTGYGWSTRPAPMDDPCNVSAEQQVEFKVDPCAPSYPYALVTSQSELDDIDAVVDYLRDLRQVARVSLVGWSGGGPRFGGYAAVHPDKVDSLVLLAPAYNRQTNSDPPVDVPARGVPMIFGSQLGSDAGRVSAAEVQWGNGYAAGIDPAVLATNATFDPLGATWGVGLVRAPTATAWGWNAQLAARVTAPALLMSGEFDTRVLPQNVRDLFADIGSSQKLFLELACTSHRAQHQTQYAIVQQASLSWLVKGSVEGKRDGVLRLGD
jgi:pimeloyl-ACP methyl ester carboxylesterase